MTKDHRLGELVLNPLFVGWIRDRLCGWLASCSSDSRAECIEMLRSGYPQNESVVLPMGETPE